ncbi:hypothetical protein ACWDZ8_43125 [Streptomyces sp. NPDC003233]
MARTLERCAGIPLPPGLDGQSGPPAAKDAAGEGLARTAALLWSAAELVSGGLPAVPDFEAKLGMGLHLFQVTDALVAIEARLAELGWPPRERRARAAGARLTADTPAERILWLAYGELLARAVAEAQRVADGPGALADGPTRRLLRLHLPELRAAAEWGADAADRYATLLEPGERAAFVRWRESVEITVPDVRLERTAVRTERARRDSRFSIFADTRDYRAGQPESADEAEAYAADALELARTNRDEIDAIETFALVWFDLLDQVPLAMLHDLARTAWDEARHALLGHQLLEHLDLDPYAVPCSMIGIEVRARLGGWDALAQISLFGELNIIGPMRSLAARAHAVGDHVVGDAFDFICSDESQHLKRIRRWLRELHPLGDLAAIEEHTKRLAGRELERAGVIGEDYFVRLTSREIFDLLGE